MLSGSEVFIRLAPNTFNDQHIISFSRDAVYSMIVFRLPNRRPPYCIKILNQIKLISIASQNRCVQHYSIVTRWKLVHWRHGIWHAPGKAYVQINLLLLLSVELSRARAHMRCTQAQCAGSRLRYMFGRARSHRYHRIVWF